MGKAVLISIQPYWVFLIIAKVMGWNVEKEKTVEVRKSYPKDDDWDKTAKVYCSKDKKSFSKIPQEYQLFMEQFLGKVIGEFVCDKLVWVLSHPSVFAGHPLLYRQAIDDACLTDAEVEAYSGGKDVYGWHISDLVIYDKPMELSEFDTYCDRRCLDGKHCKHNEYFEWFHSDMCTKPRKLTRPPQSWCYVEEVQ